MHLFYIDNSNFINLQKKQIYLCEDEAHHAIKVLRVKPDELVNATDGKGRWFKCRVVEVSKKECLLDILDIEEDKGKRDYKIHIAVAPTKNIKRIEWFLEKATEIGIDEITPIITSHSERREMKVERSAKVITSAVKQSLKAYHPVLNPLTSYKSFIENISEEEKYIAHYIGNDQDSLSQCYKASKDVCIVIGPEGDFSKEEVSMAIEKGFKAVKMGNERLRTETAALVACNTIHFIND